MIFISFIVSLGWTMFALYSIYLKKIENAYGLKHLSYKMYKKFPENLKKLLVDPYPF